MAPKTELEEAELIAKGKEAIMQQIEKQREILEQATQALAAAGGSDVMASAKAKRAEKLVAALQRQMGDRAQLLKEGKKAVAMAVPSARSSPRKMVAGAK